jgi:oligopeptide transport system substrate-binding protein
MVALNDSVRYQKYREMDSLVISQAPVIILYYDRVLRLSGNNVTGLRMNSMNLLTLKTVKN